MSNLSDFVMAGGKPKLITRYTSGTGTYVPTADMARCFIRVQGGGGGGSIQCGGGGGAMIQAFHRIPIAGFAYSVAAAAAGNTLGSFSVFGPMSAAGGRYDIYGNTESCHGGLISMIVGGVTATGGMFVSGTSYSGVEGGQGGYNGVVSGMRAGFPMARFSAGSSAPLNNAYSYMNNGVGFGSGGDSFYGAGAASGTSATNYGAGGGAGITNSGGGGLIEIWDYGV